jgi:hypothetical protein
VGDGAVATSNARAGSRKNQRRTIEVSSILYTLSIKMPALKPAKTTK